jgi:hypothetical protein
MKSCESTVDGTRILSETSRREITNGVAVGEALGAIWAECESSNNPFTLKWESIGSKWRIIAKYDSNRRRDAQAENAVYYHSSMNAPFAEAIIVDPDGNRLEQLDE